MSMAEMKDDLAAVYTKPEEGDLARGVTRQAVLEITGFYRGRVEHFSKMAMNCSDCRFLAGTFCRHFQDRVPDDFRVKGCDDWQWDGVPW